MGCIVCGSPTEIAYGQGTSGQEANRVNRCTSTGAFGVGCIYCGHVWHSAIKPWNGEQFFCPNCGGNSIRNPP